MKKRWILIPIIAGLLALMVAGGAVLAQGNGHSPSRGTANDLASRVAQILSLDEATVQSAFNQAHRDLQDERLQSLLDRMVAAEKLAEEDAAAAMEWYRGRPDGAVRVSGAFFFGREMLQDRLEHMVRAGVITGAEAEEVRAWLAERPDVLPAIGHGPREKWHGFHQGPMRRGKDGGDAGAFFRGPIQRGQDGDGGRSFFRGPMQRGQDGNGGRSLFRSPFEGDRDGGDAGSFRWAPQSLAPSSTTSGIFY